jgi:tRNA nucleotidyltransferase/poly(A) polymerase
MELVFPGYVKTVMSLLEARGFDAYVVGGAVRDLLLGRTPDDYDIVTNARPDEIRIVAEEGGLGVIDELGQNFGVVNLLIGRYAVEVASYRNETYGSDSHRPAEVWYCETLQEDLGRRDFTINAMAVDSHGRLIDCFDGLDDLRGKVLRTVGNAPKRFQEDALRMFRACRFIAQLGFNADKAILPAIQANLERVSGLSLERVRTELNKLLCGPYAGRGMDLMVQSGLAATCCRIRAHGTYEAVPILPEVAELCHIPQNPSYHPYDVWTHTARALDKGDRSLEVGWAILLHDVGKGRPGVRNVNQEGMPTDYGHEKLGARMAEAILTRLRMPEELVRRVAWLVRSHMHFGFVSAMDDDVTWRWIRKEARSGTFRINKEMADAFKQLTAVCVADIAATTATRTDVIHAQMYGRRLVRMAYTMPVHTSDLNLNGSELMEIGATRRQLRTLMPYLLTRVQDGTVENSPESLLMASKGWLRRQEEKEIQK